MTNSVGRTFLGLSVIICQTFVDLWVSQDSGWLSRQCTVGDALASARTIPEMIRALLNVEELLCDADMLQPRWYDRWADAWRASLPKCTEMRHIIVYVAALQVRLDQSIFVSWENFEASVLFHECPQCGG